MPRAASPQKRLLTLQPQPAAPAMLEAPKLRSAAVPVERAVRPPRYIIDARPVSYDLPPSF
jgi:hypothetical protein